jgi:hypothetical protein
VKAHRIAAGVALAAALFAGPPAAGQAAPGASVDAGEPALVLPEVVLKIEDLSVASVVAGLPAAQELLPPERTPPLPALAEPRIPDIEPPVPAGPELEGGARLGGVAAEAVLGAGTLSHTYGRLSIFRAGEGPRFGLKFLHEMQDGLGGEDPGTGYYMREDSLEADGRTVSDRLQVEASGKFRDAERGLQEQSPYYSRTLRDAQASVDATWLLAERLDLTAGADAAYSSDLLSGASTGSSSRTRDGSQVAPSLGLRYKLPGFEAGIEGGYRYVTGLEDVQRVRVDARAAWDHGEAFGLKARAGWHWSSQLGSLFPFQLALSGAVAPLTIDLGGGYRVQELDAPALLARYPLVEIAGTPEDNRGWFASGRFGIAVAPGLSVLGSLAWSADAAMPDPRLLPGDNLDPATGLLSFAQEQADRLSGSAGLRWNPRPMIGLTAALDAELLDRPTLEPRYRLRVDAEGSEVSGRWGAAASARVDLDSEGDPDSGLVPVFDASAYWRVSRPVTISLEGNDLLAGLVDGPRYRQYPFVEPGTSVILKVQINL